MEEFTFSVLSGASAFVSVATLANRPPRSAFRPLWMEVEFASFVPGSSTVPATFTPVGFQASFGTGGAQGDATSVAPLRLASTTPQRVRVHNHAPEDWYAYSSAASTQVATLTAVCIGTPSGSGSSAYVRGVVRMKVAVTLEVSASACPTVHVDSEAKEEPFVFA